MATELGLLSLTQLQQLAQAQAHQAQQQPHSTSTTLTGGSPWMYNSPRSSNDDDDDSWEVRAFAEDTNNAMGTTWPPRSYTCTFCRREFRSAQALGGHMNVHRRDRARLRQSPPISADPSSSSTSSSTLIFPTQEFIAANGGLCLLYPISTSPSSVFTSTSINGCLELSPSTLLSMSNYQANNLLSSSTYPPVNFSAGTSTIEPTEAAASINCKQNDDEKNNDNNNSQLQYCNNNNSMQFVEELDLELRLGSSKPSA